MKRKPRRKRKKRAGQKLDAEAFGARVEAATRAAGFEIERREGLDLYVIPHDQPVRCNLKIAYSAYKNAPQRLDEIVQVHLDSLRRVPPTPPPPTEEEAARSLLPMLNPARFLDAIEKKEAPPLVHRPFVGGLIVTYVFDFPHHRAYINDEILAKMMAGERETTFDEIHEYALENLRQRTKRQDYEMHGRRDETMISCETNDGYAATRILLPGLMKKWASRIPGRMLIGIPNRDFLIAFSDRDPARVAALAAQVRRDAAERDHPLCADLLVWQDGRIREHRPKQ